MGLIENIARLGAGDSKRLEIDGRGETIDLGVASDAGSTIIVQPVTDALKETSLGRVTGSFDRDQVWELVGISIPMDVALALPDRLESVVEVVDHLRGMAGGVDVIERSDDP